MEQCLASEATRSRRAWSFSASSDDKRSVPKHALAQVAGQDVLVDDHQRAMWTRMLDRLLAFETDEIDLTKLVRDLRGLFVEADPHAAHLRDDFELHWIELDMNDELRTQTWAPPGAYDKARVHRGIDAFRDWVAHSVLADSSSDHN